MLDIIIIVFSASGFFSVHPWCCRHKNSTFFFLTRDKAAVSRAEFTIRHPVAEQNKTGRKIFH